MGANGGVFDFSPHICPIGGTSEKSELQDQCDVNNPVGNVDANEQYCPLLMRGTLYSLQT